MRNAPIDTRSFEERQLPNWTVAKEGGGATFFFRSGTASCGDEIYVSGLSREQAAAVDQAVRNLTMRAINNMQHTFREALGVMGGCEIKDEGQ